MTVSVAPVTAPISPGALDAMPGMDAAAATRPGAPSAFASLMQTQLDSLNTDLSSAESALRDLAAGKPVELHEVMINVERARVSVQTFVQVRNKVIEAYQDLMRMQL
jgi:flagellar hook-basal body complex protein FliE